MTKEILLHKNKKEKEKTRPYSGTFGCPNTQANASQPKEPSFCHRTYRPLIIQTLFILKNDILKNINYFSGLIIPTK